ncbi:MAG TPA: NAD-dependent epimerase/dehydratase family protein [Vicinamibacterales bacterium]
MNSPVAGGAGFIGSSIAQELCQAGHEVTVIDNLVSDPGGGVQ